MLRGMESDRKEIPDKHTHKWSGVCVSDCRLHTHFQSFLAQGHHRRVFPLFWQTWIWKTVILRVWKKCINWMKMNSFLWPHYKRLNPWIEHDVRFIIRDFGGLLTVLRRNSMSFFVECGSPERDMFTAVYLCPPPPLQDQQHPGESLQEFLRIVNHRGEP